LFRIILGILVLGGGNFPLSGREFPMAQEEEGYGPTSNGRHKKRRVWEGRGREKRKKKGRGAACHNNKMSFPCPGQ